MRPKRTRHSRALGLAMLALLVPPAGASGQVGGGGTDGPLLFRTADRCMACHNGLVTSTGEDISMGFDWRASMMANSARDPYWQAAVRREVMDHPESREAIEDECSKCHMPMARYEAHAAGRQGTLFAHLPPGGGASRSDLLAMDGVSCSLCHQIQPQGLGGRESYVGGFVVDSTAPWGERDVFGPFQVDPGRARVMHSAADFRPNWGDHLAGSEYCATCHTLYTHALGPGGEVVGRLPEQVPYLEWKHSSYPGDRSCQDCHMPVVRDSVPVSSVLPRPREDVSRHSFLGANFFVLRMMNRHRDELGVQALPQELDAAAEKTVMNLTSHSATVEVEIVDVANGALAAEVSVENLTGHKLPTAYPSRRAWLRVVVTDWSGLTIFESGALRPDGSIEGNNNDEHPGRVEPHYTEIVYPEQVQIYEAVLHGPDGGVTTGLLTATGFAKDNRLLPRGFDKTTAATDIAVHGGAATDRDFQGMGDRIRYTVPLNGAPGPFTVRAELWYQPIGFRWARSLEGLGAMETERFTTYYREMASGSAVMLASGEARAR